LTKYRALVTDVNLLGTMDGWEVAKRAREIEPEFPIVHMTGARADEYSSRGRLRLGNWSPPFPSF
jgi:CheY-like chemotaxis protein